MLVLSRKLNQSIMIGDDIELTIVDVKGDQVRIGIAAPKEIAVLRKEIYEKARAHNVEAAGASVENVEAARKLLGGGGKRTER